MHFRLGELDVFHGYPSFYETLATWPVSTILFARQAMPSLSIFRDREGANERVSLKLLPPQSAYNFRYRSGIAHNIKMYRRNLMIEQLFSLLHCPLYPYFSYLFLVLCIIYWLR